MLAAEVARDVLGGVFPVLQTPFTETENIDEPVLHNEVDWVFDCGVRGVTVAMVSEVLRLSSRERQDLVAAVCAAAAGRGPAIVSVGAESTSVAVALAEHAEGAGAAAVMAVPPLTVSVGERELELYFEAILAATGIPLVVQDASSYVGNPIPLTVLARLQERHGERVYFKPEAEPLGPRLTALLKATDGKARAYDGSGGVALVDTFRRGLVGSMPAADVCWAVQRIWDALSEDDYATAYRVSLPLSALVALQTSLDAYVAIEKYLLVKQKVFHNAVRRRPVAFEVDSATAAHVDALFELLTASCSDGAAT